MAASDTAEQEEAERDRRVASGKLGTEGRKEGRKEGRNGGREEGRKRGRNRGRKRRTGVCDRLKLEWWLPWHACPEAT
jgi:hypothetical protein